ncbi:MAG: hypothetical protein AB9880_02445 [Christensenellales bacterium]
MKTRLLWLLLLALGLLCALGLLVVSAEAGDLPRPPATMPAAAALPPPQAIPRADETPEPLPLSGAPDVTDSASSRPCLASDANGLPLGGGSHADSAYCAFHFSDEAG